MPREINAGNKEDAALLDDPDHALSSFFHSFLSIVRSPTRAQVFALACALDLDHRDVEQLVNAYIADEEETETDDELEDSDELEDAGTNEGDSNSEELEDPSEAPGELDELEDEFEEDNEFSEEATLAPGELEGLPADDEVQEALQTDGEDSVAPDPDDLAIQNDGEPDVEHPEDPGYMFEDGEPETSAVLASVTYLN